MASFLSDNVAGIHPAIIEAIIAANNGDALPYGDDDLSTQLDTAFSELFETEVAIVPCTSGTAANALALSLLAGPTDAVCAHAGSHVYADECNAPEFFSGGARMLPIHGHNGKLDTEALTAAMARKGDRHAAQPAAITLAQATETGTVYTAGELADLSKLACRHGLGLHVDGARFANAIVNLDCRPAELTWKVGVDVLSFGATKNGCLAAEAVVLFNTRLSDQARFRAKRGGQLLSKMRFISAQLLAYLEHDLWLGNARQANATADRLYQGLARHPGIMVNTPPASNMVFARMPEDMAQAMRALGVSGDVDHAGMMRLCTSWRTTTSDIDRLLEGLGIDSASIPLTERYF